jgi:hypothetical protein
MAHGPLGLSEEEWWSITPRTTSNMIRNWRNIEIGRYKLLKYVFDGGEIEIDEDKEDEPDIQEGDARFI